MDEIIFLMTCALYYIGKSSANNQNQQQQQQPRQQQQKKQQWLHQPNDERDGDNE